MRNLLFTSVVYPWRAGSNMEVRPYYFTAREVIILIVSKSHVYYNGFHNNQLVNQSKYLE